MQTPKQVLSRFQQGTSDPLATTNSPTTNNTEARLNLRVKETYAQLTAEQPDATVCPLCNGEGWFTLDIPWNHPTLYEFFGKAIGCPCQEEERAVRKMQGLLKEYSLPESHLAYTLDVWRGMDEGKLTDKDVALSAVMKLSDQGSIRTKNGAIKPGVVLSGQPGVGKTSLLVALSMALLSAGKAVQWVDYNQLIEEVQASYDKRSKGPSSHELVKLAQNAPILVLDDMGDMSYRDSVTDNKRDITYSVVRPRAIRGLPMFISTNLTRSQFKEVFGPRITRRVFERCAWIEVKGADLTAY